MAARLEVLRRLQVAAPVQIKPVLAVGVVVAAACPVAWLAEVPVAHGRCRHGSRRGGVVSDEKTTLALEVSQCNLRTCPSRATGNGAIASLRLRLPVAALAALPMMALCCSHWHWQPGPGFHHSSLAATQAATGSATGSLSATGSAVVVQWCHWHWHWHWQCQWCHWHWQYWPGRVQVQVQAHWHSA